ncbi:MAG TPA: tetratricopeptide repeat protein [Edaphobacter sp.]|nr:tetratricopeptide repeat protein [Edaphobacter sp.]
MASLLIFTGRYDEAVSVLQPLSDKSPDDEGLRIDLGGAQLHAGKTVEGEKNLVLALNQTSDPNQLNGAAYELAVAGVDLEVAEKSVRKIIDTLTTESKEWSLDAPELEAKKKSGHAESPCCCMGHTRMDSLSAGKIRGG